MHGPLVPFVPATDRTFLAASATLFVGGVVLTVAWSLSTGAMPMPGGWTMSMAWMPMPGQTWVGAAASFLGMWTVMMVAMMLPSLVPMLLQYRRAVRRQGRSHLGWLTALAGLGYFFVWALVGLIAFPLGVGVTAVEMSDARIAGSVPTIVGLAIVSAGWIQCTTWKMRQLACCRAPVRRDACLAADGPTAWRYGWRIGLHCTRCCASLTAILFAVGIMDLCTMVAVALAINIERLAPAGELAARMIGAAAIVLGLYLLAQASALG
jgi:predicted metal-binding membrane protein